MQPKTIIETMRTDGCTLIRIAEILRVSERSIYRYKNSLEPSLRIYKKMDRNYKIYKLINELNEN